MPFSKKETGYDDDLSPRERRVYHDQIVINIKVTIGITLIAVGLTVHLTRFSLDPTLFNNIFFSVSALAYLIPGLYLMASGLSLAKEKFGPRKVSDTKIDSPSENQGPPSSAS